MALLNRSSHASEGRERLARDRGARGFSLVEVLVALSLLAVGLLTLAAVFAASLQRMTAASWDIIAKEKASEAIENILAARDAGRLQWNQIQNVGSGAGVFKTGEQALVDPGPDRLVQTADDLTNTPMQLRRPGPNGNLGDGDDEIMNLNGIFTRQIVISTVSGTTGNTLREIRVIVKYKVSGIQRTFQMSSYVSSYNS